MWRRGVAQLGRALRLGRRCRRFESCLPDHFLSENGLRMRTKFERTTKCRASRQSLSPSFRRRKLATWHSPDGSGQSCLPDHFLSENGLRMRTKFERTRSAVHHGPPLPSEMPEEAFLQMSTASAGRGQRTIQSIRNPEEDFCSFARSERSELNPVSPTIFSRRSRMRTKFERTAQPCLPDELGKASRLYDSYTIRGSLSGSLRYCRSQTIG